jgi:hypothetical protein
VNAPPIRCHSLRRVNPFLGVVQVIEGDGARAISLDGVDWEIQVETQSPDGLWGSMNAGRATRRYFRFGLWSRRAGLWRVPVNPILDIGEMLAEQEAMLTALAEHAGALPFPLSDRYELWALDNDAMPLALLATSDSAARAAKLRAEPWQAAPLTDHRFHSRALDAEPARPGEAENPRRHAAAVEALVRRVTGTTVPEQWFERLPDGSGRGLGHRVPAPLCDRRLSASEFPERLVRETWPAPCDAALIADYLVWLAPQLLTLQGLSDVTRARVEHDACAQAVALDALYPLYPRVLDYSLVDAARVEARLRRAASA